MVVAVHAYHNIAWFSLFCEAAGIFHEKTKISIKRCLDIDEYKDIFFTLTMKWFNTIRQGFNTIVQNLKCMMDKINISLSGVNRLQWDRAKEVTDVLEGQLLYELFYWRWQWPFCRAEKEICCHTNLGVESNSVASDSNFRWLGVSSNLQKFWEYFS